MRARDDELADECKDPEFKAQLGVGENEQLMVSIFLGEEWEDGNTPEKEAEFLVGRLKRPVVVIDDESGEVLAFLRPAPSA